jgi:hypothetical protein
MTAAIRNRSFAPVLLFIAAALAACAAPAARVDGAYSTPVWTRGFCSSLDWRRQGASDAARFKHPERRFAALDRACGIHMRVPKDEYMAGFAAAR